MLRLLFRVSLLLTALLILPVVGIRARPYDDSELRRVFAPLTGCVAPCFLGIQPGVTTVDEAIGILEDHVWVGEIDTATSQLDNGMIVFRWTDSTPKILDRHTYALLNVWDETIRYMVVPTTVPTGYLVILEGTPTDTTLIPTYNRPAVSARNFERSLVIYARPSCPFTRDSFWDSPGTMIFRDNLSQTDREEWQTSVC
jgi:hypothetical protein